MAQTNFTPISLYYSATAAAVPTAGNLVAGELAINTADGKLFYKDSAGVVQTIASKDVNSGTFTNISVSGVASFADGTVSLPSITNIGDTNTGIYFPAADTIAFTEGGAESMRIDSAGNLGVGTSSPNAASRATILSSGTSTSAFGNVALRLSSNGSGYASTLVFSDEVANSAGISMVSGNLAFGTSGFNTERMRIDSSGRLLINTTTADTNYRVRIEGAAATGSPLRCSMDTTSGATQVGFFNPNGSVGNISTSASATSYNTSSDYRLKENIAPMTGALARVSALKPVTYQWKVDGSAGEGFIAHELQAVVPDCVTGEKDAVQLVDIKDEEGNVIGQEEKPVYQGIDTSFLVATLTAAIQELKAELDSIKAELQTLKGN